MAIIFPPSPTPGQTFVGGNGVTYTYNNTLGVWTASGQGGTVISPATLVEAKAGTLSSVYSSPQTAVPKDAAGMTGAALLPTGTDLQRAAIASPVAGMTRFNTDYTPDSLEVYNGTSWGQLAYVPDLGTLTDLIPVNGSTLPAAGNYENIIINPGVTVNVPSTCYLTARTSIQINGTINANGVGNVGGSIVSVSGAGANSGPIGQGLGSTTNSYGFATSFVGSGGQSSGTVGAGAGTNIASGSGGKSGGTFIVKCYGPITVGAAAVIQASGQNGAPGLFGGANYSIPGAGGGSGGLIVLQSNTSLSLASGSQLTVNGGNGANALVGGTLAPSGGGGGGGGGGGYVVLSSPSTTDASTKNLSGGTGGSTVTTGASYGGGVGGGFGGAGGNGSNTAANGAAGSTGLVILNAYI